MTDVVIDLEQPVLRLPRRKNLQSAVTGKRQVTLEIDGVATPVSVGGQSTMAFKVSLDDTINGDKLATFIARYRANPGATRPDADVAAALHRFLFANGNFDAPFAAASAPLSAVLLRAAASDPLLTNVPWELTDGIAEAVSHDTDRPLIGTLAALPFARVVRDTTAAFVGALPPERLRVLYAINEPPDRPFGAERFAGGVERVLAGRPTRLNYYKAGDGRTVSFEQLRAGVVADRPHVVVIACHGQTVDAGVAELLFEKWYPAAELASELVSDASPALVLLIACDLTHQSDRPGAQSGALAMIGKGIPAVVAMQSSVNAELAAEFLSGMLDHMLESGSMLDAAAAGRKRMAPGHDARSYADWSFPTLFIAGDTRARLPDLRRYFDVVTGELESLARSISPPPGGFLDRPQIMAELGRFFGGEQLAGVCSVVGAPGVGKSVMIRAAARDHLVRLATRNAVGRPLLYVDLERVGGPLRTSSDLLETLVRRTRDVFPGGSALLKWPSARSADGGGESLETFDRIVTPLELNRVILVIDNVSPESRMLVEAFASAAAGLLHSFVVIVSTQALPPDVASRASTRIGPFAKDETEAFSRMYLDGWNPYELFEMTGGFPYLLANVRRIREIERSSGSAAFSGELVDIVDRGSLAMATRVVQELNKIDDARLKGALLRMVHLPSGVTGELGSRFVASWPDLLVLEQLDFLVRDEWPGTSEPLLRLPRLLADSLREGLADDVSAAGAELASAFDREVAGDAPRELALLARDPAGLDLLHDVHSLFVERESWAIAAAIPVLVQEPLFENGRWYDALRFWSRLLESAPEDETQAHEWIKYAKVAHLLGRRELAIAALATSKARAPTVIDTVERLMLEASMIKDSGEKRSASEALELYHQAGVLLADGSEAASDSESRREYLRMVATLHYNEANFRRWWTDDVDGAIAQMRAVIGDYRQLQNAWMENVALSELADMQIDLPTAPADWTALLASLFQAAEFFGSTGNNGDLALAKYRIARVYRRSAVGASDGAARLAKAADSYVAARDAARAAGDLRVEQIAEAHAAEVEWEDLARIEPRAAVERLDRSVSLLATFAGDAWSTRVRRDALFAAGRAERVLHAPGAASRLGQALALALESPLDATRGTDARRAAAILCEYLAQLGEARDVTEIAGLAFRHRTTIEEWLGRSIVPDGLDWPREVCAYGRKPGDYHG